MKKLRRKSYILLSAAAVALMVGGAAGAIGYKLAKQSKNITSISGLNPEDIVEVQLAAANNFIDLTPLLRAQESDVHIPQSDAVSASISETAQYNMLYTVNPGGQYTDIADFTFAVNAMRRQVRIQANGIGAAARASLRIGDTIVAENIPADWSGNTTLQASFAEEKDATVCVDVGGYRGGSLTICHDVNATKPQEVLLSALGSLGSLMSGVASTLFADELKRMGEQMSTVMIQQVSIIGQFFDAKHQLESQRLLQQLQAQAHKDYHPSEQMCTIGTFVRNLAQSESTVKLAKAALSKSVMARELVEGNASTIRGPRSDMLTRVEATKDHTCETFDFGGELRRLCPGTALNENQNMDVDYTSALELPLTLDIDFTDDATSDEERNAFLFLSNIFNTNPYPYISPPTIGSEQIKDPYQDLRSVSAMRSVAKNSMVNIIAQKVTGPMGGQPSTPYMRALMHDFGLNNDEIVQMIGENPSYFAQMEVLTKKLYQHPNFYLNLYDKPANIKRMRAAMKAIKLMQDRDIYNALLRREMLMSMLLETDIRVIQSELEDNIKRINKQE